MIEALKIWSLTGTEAGGYVPPAPDSLKVTLQDVDGSSATRSSNGTMIRDRIVGGSGAKRKIELEWKLLKPTECSAILQSISDVFFYVKYPDPYTGDFRTCQMYAGDRSAPVMRITQAGTILWESVSFNLIER